MDRFAKWMALIIKHEFMKDDCLLQICDNNNNALFAKELSCLLYFIKKHSITVTDVMGFISSSWMFKDSTLT